MSQAAIDRAGADACGRCGAPRDGMPYCVACDALQPLARDADHFQVLGLPRGLAVDGAELERRYHEASRRVHPDRHQTAGPAAQALSIEASAAVNRAYRTLRDPVGRGRYWLELHGEALGQDNNRVPPELAALVFDVQERVAELRHGGDPDAARVARNDVAGRLATLSAALDALYAGASDASSPATLAELKRLLSDIAYLRTLARDVDAALAG
jgi:molecular chaperone HscB